MPDFNRTHMTTEQLEHYWKVKRARKKEGLPVLTDQKVWDRRKGDEHPLLGMKLLDTESETEYSVDEVTNEWYDGFYVKLVIREAGTNSHGVLFWQNVSCRNPHVLDAIKEDRNRYSIIQRQEPS